MAMSRIWRGDVGPALGDANARHGRVDGLGRAAVGGAGLGIEGLELAGAAPHEHEDAGQAPAAQFLSLHGHGFLPAQHATGRPSPPATLRKKVRRLTTPSRLVCTCMRG